MPETGKRLKDYVNWDINAGQFLIAAVIAIWAGASWVGTVTTTQTDVKGLQASITATETKLTAQIVQAKAEMTARLVDVQAQNNDQARTIRADIANLPDVRATMTQLERRMDQSDNRAAAQSSRLDLLQQAGAAAGAKIDALKDDVARLSAVVQSMQGKR